MRKMFIIKYKQNLDMYTAVHIVTPILARFQYTSLLNTIQELSMLVVIELPPTYHLYKIVTYLNAITT